MAFPSSSISAADCSHPTRCCRRTGRRHHAGRRRRDHRQRRQTARRPAGRHRAQPRADGGCCRWLAIRWRVRSGWTNWHWQHWRRRCPAHDRRSPTICMRTRRGCVNAPRTLAAAVGGTVVDHDSRVGGGGAPGVPLRVCGAIARSGGPAAATPGSPAVLPRVHDGATLIDLRCVPEADDHHLLQAVQTALRGSDPCTSSPPPVTSSQESTLVKTLTRMEPDRWEAERRRGLTIDLSFAGPRCRPDARSALSMCPGCEGSWATCSPDSARPSSASRSQADEGQITVVRSPGCDCRTGISHGLVVISRADRAAPERRGGDRPDPT